VFCCAVGRAPFLVANAEKVNDVGAFLLTDYPAVTLRPGSTSSINRAWNYGPA
jgi:hypothetical protein